MKYKDYYAILGLERGATEDAIKKAYRRLARKYHPDVSKEANAEEKFKEVAEAYQTLKDADKRKAYDALGSHAAGQEFEPPPDWQQQWAPRGGQQSGARSGGQRAGGQSPGGQGGESAFSSDGFEGLDLSGCSSGCAAVLAAAVAAAARACRCPGRTTRSRCRSRLLMRMGAPRLIWT
jgi:curved DNA-binding protein